jgi:hypothetical protein
MKNIIPAIVILFSNIAWANTYTYVNKTYPEDIIKIECQDQSCDKPTITFIDGDHHSPKWKLDKKTIEATAKNRRVQAKKGVIELDRDFYQMTSDIARNIPERFREAYFAKALGNILLLPLAVIGDTLFLPLDLIEEATNQYHIDTLKDKKGAKRLLGDFNADNNTIELRHKYFKQVEKYLSDLVLNELFKDRSMSFVKPFADGAFVNCYVKVNVANMYYQLYINNQFAGNYLMKEEHFKLRNRLWNLINDNVCKITL